MSSESWVISMLIVAVVILAVIIGLLVAISMARSVGLATEFFWGRRHGVVVTSFVLPRTIAVAGDRK